MKLNGELYSLLTTLFTGKAWSFLKSVNCQEGLEAFRFSFGNITKRTKTQLLNEFRYLNAPDSPKTVADISPWLVAWENRLRALQALNANYAIGPETRRNIAYLAMPKPLREILEHEFAKGNLISYEELTKFLVSDANSDASRSNSGPQPLTVGALLPSQPAQAAATSDPR